MTTYRISYKGIISELYVPAVYNGKAVVFLPGLPMSLSFGKSSLLQSLIDEGCAVFYPFYQGSYDSDGLFSYEHCLEDVGTFIEMARQEVQTELYYGAMFQLETKKIVLMASSFGGTVAINSPYLNEVDGLVLVSPVIEYNQKKLLLIDESFKFSVQMDGLFGLLKNAYPHTYRIENDTCFLAFLHGEEEYGKDRLSVLDNISVRTLLLHGKKDASVPVTITQFYQSGSKNDMIDWQYPDNCGHSIYSYDAEIIKK